MKKSYLLLPIIALVSLVGCNKSNNEEHHDDPTPITEDYTITFNDSYIQTCNTDSATSFNDRMKSNFNYGLSNPILESATSVEGAYAQINLREIETGDTIKALMLATQKKDSDFTLTFTAKVVSVTLLVQPHYSYYMNTWDYPEPTPIYNTDNECVFTVNDQETTLVTGATDIAPAKENKTYTLNSNTIRFTCEKSKRVLIHQMIISLEVL